MPVAFLNAPAVPPVPSAPGEPGSFWGDGGSGFKNILDILNPLQHIPVVSSVYQALTGDVPSIGAGLAGSAVFGGPIGFVSALFNTILESQTGHDAAGHLLALVTGDAAPVQVAQAMPSPAGDPLDGLSPNQRASYNAYVHAQRLVA